MNSANTRSLSRGLGRLFKNLFKARGRLSIAFLALGLIILFLVSFTGFLVYSPRAKGVCSTCHNMKPFVEGIATSGHDFISCYKCHDAFPGIYRDIIVQVFESPTAMDIKSEASKEIRMYKECTSCHDVERLSNSAIHETHLTMAIEVLGSCNICHNPHASAELASSCTQCHLYSREVNSHAKFHDYAESQLERGKEDVCLECHSPNAQWSVPLSNECLKGQARGLTCFDCHSAPLEPPNIAGQPCTRCHGG